MNQPPPAGPNAWPKRSRETSAQRQTAAQIFLLLAGTTLAGVAFNTLIFPNALAPGGVVGVAVLLEHAAGLRPAWVFGLLNAALLLVGWALLGRGFALRSLAGSVLLPVAVALTSFLPALTHERMLASLVGGGLLGLGVGLVLRANGSVGGFTTLALVFQRRWGMRVDHSLLALDATVLAGALWFLPAEAALSALVCSFVVGKAVRSVLTGGSNAQVAWVFSQRSEVLRELTLHRLDLGLTLLPGRGGFSGQSTDVLMVVMRPVDVPRFKAAVKAVDASAFVVLAEANEVLGYGFSSA